ncbi:hypothetical protein DF183_16730 [Alcaligenes faecalis]|uniref:Uncharacterized protein n=1 Tax=Alcaligenes faecalis TaxID=511 RepID=A0A2U2BHJ7_ALCFA|nr:hypothetical protein DF183_16730 [Alcaligenes faecalis]
MKLVHASIHTMKTIDGHDIWYARLGYQTARGYLGQSMLLSRLTPEMRAVAESGELMKLGKRTP